LTKAFLVNTPLISFRENQINLRCDRTGLKVANSLLDSYVVLLTKPHSEALLNHQGLVFQGTVALFFQQTFLPRLSQVQQSTLTSPSFKKTFVLPTLQTLLSRAAACKMDVHLVLFCATSSAIIRQEYLAFQ
jgi:hypothetical protein